MLSQGSITMITNCVLLIVSQVKELPTLQKELIETKQALANANQDKEKLLQEIRKYNPLFDL
jgi:large-conductance mechanosensitive channel